jgi:aspartate carbamoyltransferase catalytic subunit
LIFNQAEESMLRHLYEIQQLSGSQLPGLLALAKSIESRPGYYQGRLTGRIVSLLFYEASTRTYSSFASAALKLGAQYIGPGNTRQFSSAVKGETLADTVRVMSGYVDAIVLRYDQTGGAQEAAKYATVPIINAGDGTGQHPTQALLDLYTILKHVPRLEDKEIVLVGDLGNGRTVHSLAYLLAKHYPNNRLVLLSPNVREVKMPPHILQYLASKGVAWREGRVWGREVLRSADIVYMTRVQQERFKDKPLLYTKVVQQASWLNLTPELVGRMKPSTIILHPLPRLAEIPPEIDRDPRAKYFEQARNGLYVRMALLLWLLGAAEDIG